MRSRTISRLVQDRGLRGKDMAKLFGINERTWYDWSTCPERFMTVGRIRILAEALNLSEWEIIEIVKGGKTWD